jgi:hypothetical protein
MEPVDKIQRGGLDRELQDTLDRIGEMVAACEEESKPQPAKVIRLPVWPEPQRGAPNSALRGALFAAIQGKDRRYLKGELLTAQQGIKIRFTGMQLNQSDLDVWEQALHLARQHPLGTQCHFTAYGFLKALGRPTGGDHHEWLKDVFRRLAGAVAEITHNRMTYFGSMIEGGIRDEDTGQYVLEINPKIMALYSAGWTAADWDQRQLLRGKPLALWLHGFYSSHADPYPLTVEYLHQLSGGRTAKMRKFKQNLKTALGELVKVGVIRDFEIEGDLVSVDRVPSKSQQKHLTRRKK